MSKAVLELGLAVPLAVAVVVSGVWLTRAKHDTRQLFVELEELNREQDRLQVDWGRLQLEQSTWANHSRIEAFARDELGMQMPDDARIVVVMEPQP
jgi:cell division protein FtsL